MNEISIQKTKLRKQSVITLGVQKLVLRSVRHWLTSQLRLQIYCWLD